MALVHVVDGRLIAECGEHAGAAHAEDGFLAEAVVAIAAVEAVGEIAVFGVIYVQVSVEQVDADLAAGYALDGVTEGADGDGTAFDLDGDPGLLGFRVERDVPGLGFFGLLAVGGEVLAEVAFPMGEGNGDQREAHVGGGAEGVAGEHAQAARVGVHLGLDGDLHGEVGDDGGFDVV